MDKLEKLIWIVAGFAVVGVIAFVAIGPLKSGISYERMIFEKKRDQARRQFEGEAPQPVQRQGFNQVASRPATAPGKAPEKQPEQPAQVSPYTRDANTVIPSQQVFIPDAMVQKYQHWEDVYDLSMTAYGEDVVLPDGTTAFELKEINEDSPLQTILEFKPRDIVISINGYAANKANGRQLYETLKAENNFAVRVLRNGQEQTLNFRR